MVLTINTDISFYGRFKVAGWSYYMICDTGNAMYSAPFKSQVTDTLHAEMLCIANALEKVYKSKVKNVQMIIFKTGSDRAIELMKRRTPTGREELERALDYIQDLIYNKLRAKYKIKPRHQRENNAPFIDWRYQPDKDDKLIDEWCKSKSKEAMFVKVDEIKRAQKAKR